jgi:hypothetical protein
MESSPSCSANRATIMSRTWSAICSMSNAAFEPTSSVTNVLALLTRTMKVP